jgi:hypothetical protein
VRAWLLTIVSLSACGDNLEPVAPSLEHADTLFLVEQQTADDAEPGVILGRARHQPVVRRIAAKIAYIRPAIARQGERGSLTAK